MPTRSRSRGGESHKIKWYTYTATATKVVFGLEDGVGWGWDEPTFSVFGWESAGSGISPPREYALEYSVKLRRVRPREKHGQGRPTSTASSSRARAVSAGFLSLPRRPSSSSSLAPVLPSPPVAGELALHPPREIRHGRATAGELRLLPRVLANAAVGAGGACGGHGDRSRRRRAARALTAAWEPEHTATATAPSLAAAKKIRLV